MAIKIISFGQLVAVTGSGLVLEDSVADTDALKQWLENRHPGLAQLTYVMAVDKKIIVKNTILTDQVTVALLPPFSGG